MGMKVVETGAEIVVLDNIAINYNDVIAVFEGDCSGVAIREWCNGVVRLIVSPRGGHMSRSIFRPQGGDLIQWAPGNYTITLAVDRSIFPGIYGAGSAPITPDYGIASILGNGFFRFMVTTGNDNSVKYAKLSKKTRPVFPVLRSLVTPGGATTSNTQEITLGSGLIVSHLVKTGADSVAVKCMVGHVAVCTTTTTADEIKSHAVPINGQAISDVSVTNSSHAARDILLDLWVK